MPLPLTSADLRSVLLGIIEVQPVATVLRRLAEAALDLTGADYAAIGAYGARRELTHFEAHGISPEERGRIAHPPRGVGLIGEFARYPFTVRLDDITEHPASVGFPAGHPPMGPLLGVPLTYGDRAVGAFYVTRRPGAPAFSVEEQAELEAMAPYGAIALMNAQLLEERERRARQAEALASIALDLQEADGEEATVRTLALALPVLFPDAAESAISWSHDPDEPLTIESSSGGEELSRYLAKEFQLDPRRPGRDGLEPGSHEFTEWFDEHVVSIEVAHLEDGGRLALAVSAAQALDLVDRGSLAELLDLGVVRLAILQRRAAHDALERYEVRDTIARDLHDDIIQSVYAAGLGLRAARAQDSLSKDDAIDRASAELNSVIADLRAFIQQLSAGPEDFEPHELLATRLRALISEPRGSVQWDLHDDLARTVLEPSVDRQLYLVARELVSNVERHANAHHASLTLRQSGDVIELEVRDDGRGFERDDIDPNAVGLRSIEQRIADLGGSLLIESARDDGTVVRATVPR